VLALLLVVPLFQISVEIAPAAVLPRLSVETTSRLTASLTDFVREIEHREVGNSDVGNALVAEADRKTTAPLLHELRGLCARGDEPAFFVPYLSAAVRDEEELQIQLTYAGVLDGKPLVRAIVELIARENEHGFTFASPLARRTAGWSSEPHGAQTLHFASRPDAERVRRFFTAIEQFDSRLGDQAPRGDFYCTSDYAEAMHLTGLVYLSDCVGRKTGALAGRCADEYVFVDACYLSPATKVFDLHDLWHNRQRLVLPPEVIYRPIDEGAAYLYAGSWGLSWQEILTKFRAYAAAHPDADWLALYEASANFDPRARFPLHVDYAINALWIEQIEREHGFGPVRELLTCGPKVVGNANYFDKLEQVAGVTREAFGARVRQLLQAK
jgi:hypothetical protein